MARKRDRAFAGFFAALFLITSSAVTVAVVWDAVTNKDDSSSSSSQTDAQQKALEALNKQKEKTVDGKLAGTQLAGFTPVTSIDKLQEVDTTPGTGDEVKPGDTVTVDYTGAVAATGKIFQSSLDTGQPVSFGLSQVIKGWTDGVPGMKVGGTRRLLIPAAQAYGATPPSGSGIPANADLVFDITLHKIGQ
jgi:FKBP-type peptidyl-prolyl cis-trans isomerase